MRMRTQRTGAIPLGVVSLAAALALVLASVLAGPAAADNHDATPEAMAGEPCGVVLGLGDDTVACVAVIHASPDAPDVDILINGDAAITELAYGQFAGFVALPADTCDIQVTAAGDPATVAIDAPGVELEAGIAYEIAAVGSLGDGSIAPLVNTVDLSPLDDDTARVRVVEAIYDAPPVDIAVAGDEVLIPELEALQVTDYLDVPAIAPELEVRAAGTEDVLLPLGEFALSPNTVSTIYAAGTVSDLDTVLLIVVTVSLDGDMNDMDDTEDATPDA